jgi:hypothetical protein
MIFLQGKPVLSTSPLLTYNLPICWNGHLHGCKSESRSRDIFPPFGRSRVLMSIEHKSPTDLRSEMIFLQGKPVFYTFLPSTSPSLTDNLPILLKWTPRSFSGFIIALRNIPEKFILQIKLNYLKLDLLTYFSIFFLFKNSIWKKRILSSRSICFLNFN